MVESRMLSVVNTSANLGVGPSVRPVIGIGVYPRVGVVLSPVTASCVVNPVNPVNAVKIVVVVLVLVVVGIVVEVVDVVVLVGLVVVDLVVVVRVVEVG